MNLEGRLLDNRYEIIEKIGNGGMATVYKAKCHVLNRYVAIKILRDEFTTDQEFIRRFNSEAQAAASLTHPNIVSIYDVGNEGDLYYIVMELIQGKTLKEIINEDGALAWKWSVNVAIQIASALETAHKNNIIHRDIKPHNIIITEDGIAKVTDFGIAKAVSNSTITAFGSTIGSVHYFSPEHARGGYTDAKSDLYSLGIVMYEMLTGKVPFDADTPVSIALKHLQEKAIEPITLNPTIPLSVNKIVMKAMQKDASLRYTSATEMLRDLSMSLKNPDGNFVVIHKLENDFPTQKIPTMYDKTMEQKIREKDEQRGDNKNRNKAKKQNGFIKFIKTHKVLSSFIGIILLFIISLGGTYFAMTATALHDVQIPDVVGISSLEAKDKIEGLNLVYEVSEEEYSDDVLEGCIISQDPKYIANYTIKEKSTIKVVVSKGQKIVTVPKVTGKTLEDAKSELEELGLTVKIVEEASKRVEQGYVISQDIAANTQTSAASIITITVSTGVEKVTVPNLIGKTQEEATKAITDAGLKLSTVATAEDTSKDNGKVIKQSLDAGTSVEKDSAITITVNEIAQMKNATVTVNLKSITKYKEEKDEDGKVIEPEKVELKVTVGEDTVYKQKVSPASESININNISGVGTITIKVYVDGIVEKQTQLNLNATTSWTAE